MKKLRKAGLCLAVIALLGGCATMTVKKTGATLYENEAGDRIRAEYYTISDETLSFVKLYFSDNSSATLPQAVSASGARYSDDFRYVWWIKGQTAFFESRTDDGNWFDPIEYTEQ